MKQDTIKFVPSDIKVLTHPQQKIFTAVKSVPRCISTEENKSEHIASDSLSGNRKRKVASKYNRNTNKNTKSQESAVSRDKTNFVLKPEVNDGLYDESNTASNVQSKYAIANY